MKELDALMNALKEKKIPDRLRLTAKLIPFPKERDTVEKKQEILNEAIRACLLVSFDKDEHLSDLFSEYAYEVGMKTLIKELDIKAPEESNGIEKLLNELLKNL